MGPRSPAARRSLAVLLSLVGWGWPDGALAQRRVDGEVSGHGAFAAPVGAFSDQAGVGGGGLSLVAFPDWPLAVGFRFDATWLVSPERSLTVLATPSNEVEVRTRHSLRILTVAPLLELTSGDLRPYVQAMIGYSTFKMQTSATGAGFAGPEDVEDWSVPVGIGGGLRWGGGKDPLFPEFEPMIELGVSYVHHAGVEYLTREDIVQIVQSGLPVAPAASAASLIVLQLRLILGVRGGTFTP